MENLKKAFVSNKAIFQTLYDSHDILCDSLTSEFLKTDPLSKPVFKKFIPEYIGVLQFYDKAIQEFKSETKPS